MWCVMPENAGKYWYFTKGWERFVKDNALKAGDCLVFDYFAKDVLDFKILGSNRCEKVGAREVLYIADDSSEDENLDDLPDDVGSEDEEEEWDDDDFCGELDDDCWEEEGRGLFMKQEPKSEGDDDDHHCGGNYDDVTVKQQPKHEQGVSFSVKQESKSEVDDDVCMEKEDEEDDHSLFVKKEPKSEGDNDASVGIFKELGVKKEPKQEGDDDSGDDVENLVNHNNVVCVKIETEDEGDDGCLGQDHLHPDDEYVENHRYHNNDEVLVESEHQHEGDGGGNEDLGDYADDDAHTDIENHDNMIRRNSLQISGGADIENDDYAFVEEEPPSEAYTDDFDHYSDDDEEVENDADHGGYDDEETDEADLMLSQGNEPEEYAQQSANKGKLFLFGTKRKRHRASLFPRYYGLHIFELGLARRPSNPFFITHVSPRRKGDLFIPTELITDHQMDMPKPEMRLIDPHGRVFKGKYKKWKDGRTLYSKGWRTLWKVNCISGDDYCICEFHQGEDGKLYLQVHIIYINGGPPIRTPKRIEAKAK
ncbi:hypothetical protein F511_02805 [Dorcoceras hygrometricum]|uniref:TF-B3 domain-containing protein n=1 Tax=Dorcoceras hygrometricum TaxID=472368 RepID=A0A2Z7BI46_9LAMI|nr:hypothetical protein F511_02805 [Dorcoceras hygrometricum]